MTKMIYAISFAKPNEWISGQIIQVGVVSEKVDELREYAASLGYGNLFTFD